MKSKLLVSAVLLLGVVLGALWMQSISPAWAAFAPRRLLSILDTAGTGEVLLQQGSAVGMPVAVVSGGAIAGNWQDDQNHTLAQCGIGETPLTTDTSTSITIKVDDAATDNVWCSVSGTVAVDSGFRVGNNSEGVSVNVTDPANVECCGEGAATFKISVLVEG